jgi:hypothetical protein
VAPSFRIVSDGWMTTQTRYSDEQKV